MTTATKRRLGLALALLVGTLGLAALAGTATAGSGSPVAVDAVEGLPFSGTVASYDSTVTANQRFVAQAYLNLVGRAPDSSELAGLDDFLGTGGTRTQAAESLLGGAEYRAALARSAYETYLQRPAAATEVAFAVSMLGAGATDEQLDASLIGSAEYLATRGGGTTAGFLDALYLDVLDRPIDPAAAVALTQALAVKTRAAVALDVLNSVEARERFVRGVYEHFLHRSADAAEVQAFVGVLQNGGTDEDVIAMVAGSAEYFEAVPASFAKATIDWGDGSPSAYLPAVAATVDGSHTYADEGIYPIEVVVSDLDGATEIHGTATVADAPLTATAVSFAVPKKTAFTQTVATFVDGNPGGKASEFTASIAWGDGSSSRGTVSARPGGGFVVTGSHTYESKGRYEVAVHVKDVGGATADTVSSAEVTSKH
jgi:Domain of unknown function (DUF4214)